MVRVTCQNRSVNIKYLKNCHVDVLKASVCSRWLFEEECIIFFFFGLSKWECFFFFFFFFVSKENFIHSLKKESPKYTGSIQQGTKTIKYINYKHQECLIVYSVIGNFSFTLIWQHVQIVLANSNSWILTLIMIYDQFPEIHILNTEWIMLKTIILGYSLYQSYA